MNCPKCNSPMKFVLEMKDCFIDLDDYPQEIRNAIKIHLVCTNCDYSTEADKFTTIGFQALFDN